MASFSSDPSSSSSSGRLFLYRNKIVIRQAYYPHVLLVEDNPSTLQYLQTMFYGLGCIVTSAKTSTQARLFLTEGRKDRPKLDMICLKYDMSIESGSNGYTILVENIKRHAPVADVPVVIYCSTPNLDPQQLIELDKCKSAGALMVFREPLMLAEIMDLVKLMKQQ